MQGQTRPAHIILLLGAFVISLLIITQYVKLSENENSSHARTKRTVLKGLTSEYWYIYRVLNATTITVNHLRGLN